MISNSWYFNKFERYCKYSSYVNSMWYSTGFRTLNFPLNKKKQLSPISFILITYSFCLYISKETLSANFDIIELIYISVNFSFSSSISFFPPFFWLLFSSKNFTIFSIRLDFLKKFSKADFTSPVLFEFVLACSIPLFIKNISSSIIVSFSSFSLFSLTSFI